MGQVVTIGLDIAKSVFQVHGVDAEGAVVIRQKLTRARLLPFFAKLEPCLVGIEACGASHHWARELARRGHEARLMPPSYVKPYLKRQKNDMADAEAICEAVTRPTMRFVPVKSPEQQGVMVLHRTRLVMTRQRTQLSNAIRGHMAEFGLTAGIGREGLGRLIAVILDGGDERLTREARVCLTMLVDQLRLVNVQILENDRLIRTNARATEVGRRLMEIPGVGPLLASAWSPPWLIQQPSRPDAIWRPGSAWSLDRTPAAARSGSAASPSRAIATCGRCWWLGHWPSSATHSAMARVGRGSCSC
jgi:transposase